MKSRPGLAILAAAASAAFLDAAPSFDPEEHFPKSCIFHASIDAGALRAEFRDTPFGKTLSHPGVERAFGGAWKRLLEQLRAETVEFSSVTGLEIPELLELFTGKVALSITSINMFAGPQLIVSAAVGTKEKEIEALLKRLGAAFAAAAGGGEPSTAEVSGVQVTSWPVQFGPSIQHAIIGHALVFSVGESMETVIQRFQGKDSENSLRFNETFARAKLQASVAAPAITIFYDVGKIREFMAEVAPGQGAAVLAAIGLDKLSSFLLRTGFREGDFESKLFLDSPGGLGGFLGQLADALGPSEDEAALSMIPAASLEVSSQSIAAGKLVRAIVELKLGIPEAAPAIDAAVSRIEEATGLSFEQDLYPLPRLSILGFSALPPGGGFVPDSCAIVRTSQFQPYLVLIDRVARKIGAEVRRVPVEGRDVAYLSAGRILTRLGLEPGRGMPPSAEASAAPQHVLHATSVPDPGLTLAFAPIDAEWMVIASTPQAVGRYFSSHSKGPSIAADEASSAVIRKEVGKDASFGLLRGGRHLVFAWNTALALAMVVAPILEKQLAELGIDPAYLPPGEELAPAFRDGFFAVRRSSDGLLVHGHRVFSNLLGSPTVASALIAAGLQAEAMKTETAPGKPEGEDGLRKLANALMAHAVDHGAYPLDDERGLPSLQALVDAGRIGPEDLVHPRGEKPARAGDSGKVVLDAEHVSYELVPWKQGPTDSPGRLLAYEKKAYDGKNRGAIFVDGSVRFIEEAEFRKLLEEQTSRHGRRESAKEGE